MLTGSSHVAKTTLILIASYDPVQFDIITISRFPVATHCNQHQGKGTSTFIVIRWFNETANYSS